MVVMGVRGRMLVVVMVPGRVIMIVMVPMRMIMIVPVRMCMAVVMRRSPLADGAPAVKKESDQGDVGKDAHPHQPSSPRGFRRRGPILANLHHRGGRVSLVVGDLQAPRTRLVGQEDGAAKAIGATFLKRCRRVAGGKYPHASESDRLTATEAEFDGNAALGQRPIDDDMAGAVGGGRADRAEGEQADEQGGGNLRP
jgi:hypothetical protein